MTGSHNSYHTLIYGQVDDGDDDDDDDNGGDSDDDDDIYLRLVESE